jgi:adenine-specific DNA-methyltransferase
MAAKITPITLDRSVEIYVPTQCRCGKPLPEDIRAEVLEEVKASMYGWFGGVSKKEGIRVEKIEGSWPLSSGEMANEQVDVVYANASPEALEEHFEELPALAASIANRLTQESVAFRVDKKMTLMPGQDTKPHRCAGGASPGALPVGRQPDEKERMRALQASLQRISSVRDARDLFCNVLHYDRPDDMNAELPMVNWPDKLRECLASGTAPRIVADQNGFKILYLQLATDSLRKSSERQLVMRLIKDNPGMRGLVVVSDIAQKHWNLVNVQFDRDGKNRDKILLRRMRVGPGQLVRTAVERLSQVDVELLGEDASAADLQNKHDAAFDVEAVTKQFFNDVANWYFWALKHVEFPKDAPKEDDGHDHVSLIRLITRLIFCWFLREKGLLPDTLFDRRQLNDILTGFAPDKVRNKDSVYYRAILQNLFFATLSTEDKDRGWVREGQNMMSHSLYRHKECFQKPATALNLFKSIPFLNGGLFECLDRDLGEGRKPRYVRIDGFSRRSDSQPVVPDFLFFGPEKEIDLSAEYGDRRFRSVSVRGLIDTLRHYNFTIEENTPIEEEVALDPELCGMVFENLLAAYNPETGTTARKQSGSFYTPRGIVNYMVDEALIASLSTKLEAAIPTAKEIEPRLRHLFAYNDEPNQFQPKEVTALITAIDTLKTLDPAVGSGAFPMGLLHKLVFILGKLDHRNEQWKERQIARVREAIAVAEKIEDDGIRSRTVEDLEQQIVNVEESFDRNELDYGRKLYLIENCIYGVDIQPIAVQIAKMRFFISLIVDQKIDDGLPNRGVRPLPNLETKFVAANTLIPINRPGQQLLRNRDIDVLEAELRRIRERHFLARTPKQKAKCRDEDAKLRSAIAELLKSDGWSANTSKKLAAWNPYNQNDSAEFFDAEWMFGRNEYDRFDVVIGNPPYVFISNIPQDLREVYNAIFDTAEYRFDIYGFFIERAISDLLNHKGFLSYIIPHTLLSNDSFTKLRSLMLSKCSLRQVIDIGPSVFMGASNETMIFLVENNQPTAHSKVWVNNTTAASFPLGELQYFMKQEKWRSNPKKAWLVKLDPTYYDILERIEDNPLCLGDICTINQGLRTGDNEKFINSKPDGPKWKPVVGGRHVCRYEPLSPTEFVLYDANLLDAPRNEQIFTSKEKIVVQEIRNISLPRRLVAAYDNKKTYCLQSTNVINLLPSASKTISVKYLLALINSNVVNHFFRLRYSGNNHIASNQLASIPIPVPPANIAEKIDRLVDERLSGNMNAEAKIESLIAGLYGLSDEMQKSIFQPDGN